MLAAATSGISEKYGNPQLGYRGTDVAKPGMEYMDGRICEDDEALSLSFPLKNILLGSAEKLIPLGLMPAVRVQFSLDAINTVFLPNTAAIVGDPNTATLAQPALVLPDTVDLSDFQLCFSMIDFGSEVDDIVKSMGEKIYIKSSSFTNSSSALAANAAGTLELVYNQRLASIKSMFLFATSNASINGLFDSYNLSARSEYSFNIAGKVYPPRPITSENTIMELKKAVGSLQDKTNSMSINPLEFSRTLGDAATFIAPAKFIVGISTEVLPRHAAVGSSVLLSGVSTQSSPISVRINIPTATPVLSNISLICSYDALIEIDHATKSAYVRQ